MILKRKPCFQYQVLQSVTIKVFVTIEGLRTSHRVVLRFYCLAAIVILTIVVTINHVNGKRGGKTVHAT